MNKIFKIMFLSCIVLFAACSSDDDIIEDNTNSGEVIIGASMPDADDTRVAVDDLRLLWQDGDEVVIVGCDANNYMVGKPHIFRLVSGAGTESAKFKGVLPATPNYQMYYNCKNLHIDTNINSVRIDYSSVTQYGINNDKHLRDYLFLKSSGSIDNLRTGVTLSLENAFLRIDFRSRPDYLVIESLKWIINYYPCDYLTKEMGTMSYVGKEIDFLYNSQPETHNYLYLPFMPGNDFHRSGSEFAIEFYGKQNNIPVKATVKYNSWYEINFHPGRYDVAITNKEIEDVPNTMKEWTIENL